MQGEGVVPKVEAFKVEGLNLKFNSLDHMEPHFHVLKPGSKWEIRVYFLSSDEETLHIKYKKPPNPPANFDGISKSERKDLLEKVLKYRAELFREWEAKVQVMENYNANT
jgi:hypothetical protein